MRVGGPTDAGKMIGFDSVVASCVVLAGLVEVLMVEVELAGLFISVTCATI